MKILGLDPGTVATGFGIVVFEQGRLTLECCGVWRPPAKLALAAKLEFLSAAAFALMGEMAPAAVSVETVFAAKNIASALKLAHARGALLAAAARADLPVFEYEPRLVKKAIVGYGQAEKEQVRGHGPVAARPPALPHPPRRRRRPGRRHLPPPRVAAASLGGQRHR